MKPTELPVTDEEPLGKLVTRVSPHLRKLAEKSPAVRRQFFPSIDENKRTGRALIDPLLEDQFVKTKGLVHKYSSRVLVTLTMTCAAYCRFCTRRRIVSDIERGRLTKADIENMVSYIKKTPSINEVIMSGGDPLTVPDLLIYALKRFYKLPQIKVLRVHTRVPVSNPNLVTKEVLAAFKSIKKKPLYVSVHFEHPDELAPATLKVVKKIRETGAIMLSQSVFLKGVNDKYEVLYELFTRLPQIGIRPYYIYRCDPTEGVEHFMVPFDKEVEIMTRLRKNLSGIACPTYVVDAPNGAGKTPVPLEFWEFNRKKFKDFWDKEIEVY
jgi:lysine 2,3-aminomutase